MLRKKLAMFSIGILMMFLISPTLQLSADIPGSGLIDLSDMANRPTGNCRLIWDDWIARPNRFVDVLLSEMYNPLFVRHSESEIRQRANIVVFGGMGCPLVVMRLNSLDWIIERYNLQNEVNVLYFDTRNRTFADLTTYQANMFRGLNHVSSFSMNGNTVMFNILWGANYPLRCVGLAVLVYIDSDGFPRFITFGDAGGGVPNKAGYAVFTQELISITLGRDITNTSPATNPNGADFGTLNFCNGVFRGYHVDGQRVRGRFYWHSGSVFEGEYINTPDGLIRRGQMEWTSGNVFVGDAWDTSGDQITGRLYFVSGAVFEGRWQREANGLVRIGTHTRPDGTQTIGRFDHETGRFLG